jgi:hypothetical protein
MPARADSRPDFVRGFGLDITEEEEEEEEEQYAEQHEESLLEGHEEEQAVADASHIALAGADDTIDMELDVDEADAEVGNITTAAQSRVHSRHVSRLSAALSLRSVNGNMGVSEAEAEREREGDPEDDAIGEWTGSEDLRAGTETAEDEVRKFLPRCFHACALTINLIMPVPFPPPSIVSFSFHAYSFFLPLPGEHRRVVKPIGRRTRSSRTSATSSHTSCAPSTTARVHPGPPPHPELPASTCKLTSADFITLAASSRS